MPKFYSGFGFSLRGEKNRFVLPPSFRNTIFGASGTRTLCLVQNKDPRCLTGFGLNRAEDLEEQLAREEDNAIRLGREFNEFQRRKQLFTFEQIPFDASGRFVMPDYLVESAGLEDSFCAIGFGKYFTLWAPGQLYAQDAADYGAEQAACRSLEAEARAKGKKA